MKGFGALSAPRRARVGAWHCPQRGQRLGTKGCSGHACRPAGPTKGVKPHPAPKRGGKSLSCPLKGGANPHPAVLGDRAGSPRSPPIPLTPLLGAVTSPSGAAPHSPPISTLSPPHYHHPTAPSLFTPHSHLPIAINTPLTPHPYWPCPITPHLPPPHYPHLITPHPVTPSLLSCL